MVLPFVLSKPQLIGVYVYSVLNIFLNGNSCENGCQTIINDIMEKTEEELQKIAAEKVLSALKDAHFKTIHVVIPPAYSQKLRSYVHMGEDFKYTHNATMELLQSVSEPGHHISTIDTALWHSIVVTYAKPFTASRSGFTDLKPSCFDKRPEFLIIHERLMDLRNKLVAHREKSDHEHSLMFLRITKNGSNPQQINYHVKSIIKSNPSINDLKEYLPLFNYLSSFTDNKIAKEAEKIWKLISKAERETLLQLIVDENYQSLI
jgi:hypothetical protein